MSLIGRWASWYQGLQEPQAYGEETSYHLAAEFLDDCETVQDWGCGKGFFRTICRGQYLGIDGTKTPFCDVVADLTEFRSEADGVLLRHVIEHNYGWPMILESAAATARRKICIVLFTPVVEETREIAFTEPLGVPDISFAIKDVAVHLRAFDLEHERIETVTQYGEETIIRAVRQ